MSTKEYIKKIIVTDELSTPEARAERLKRLRNLTNLSRKELCEFCQINPNTYKGWELGRYGGLPADGAEKMVSYVLKLGVICTVDWLLYGKEPSPSLALATSNCSIESNDIKSNSLALIKKEFAIFQTALGEAVLEQVMDDSIAPLFKKGDYVAGIKLYHAQIDAALEQICIIQTIDGKKLIRCLKKGEAVELYSLISINPYSECDDLAVLNTRLIYAAPIYRHYILSDSST